VRAAAAVPLADSHAHADSVGCAVAGAASRPAADSGALATGVGSRALAAVTAGLAAILMAREESAKDAYERGENAGRVDLTLIRHGQHLEKINGSQAAAVVLLQELKLGLELLSAKFDASIATELAKAKALKEAEEARRDKVDQSWSPFAKTFATLAAVAALVGVIVLLSGHVRFH
jgi:hypothetical protein